MNETPPPAFQAPVFQAYASRLQLLLVQAGMAPIAVVGLVALPLLPGAPLWGRLIGLAVVAPVLVWLGINLRLLLMRGPVITLDEQGLLWRRWSPRRIGWDAIERWQVKRHMNIDYVCIWLRDPAAHRATTIQRLLSPMNHGMGMGHIALGAGGTNRSFPELAAAMARFAPLPEDPRLARRLLARRSRGEGVRR